MRRWPRSRFLSFAMETQKTESIETNECRWSWRTDDPLIDNLVAFADRRKSEQGGGRSFPLC